MNLYRVVDGKLAIARLMYRSSKVMQVQVGRRQIQCPLDMYHETPCRAWKAELREQQKAIADGEKEIEKLKASIDVAKEQVKAINLAIAILEAAN